MAGPNNYRIDTSALKHQIERKLGNQRSQKYFNLLSQYLSCKISKSNFNKLCISLIGRENLRFHNILIQAILKNTSLAKSPPPKERDKEGKLPYGLRSFPFETTSLENEVSLCTSDPLRLSDARAFNPGLPTYNSKSKEGNDNKSIPKVQQQQSISLEDGEEVDQVSGNSSIYSRSPVRAPFGISINGKEPRKVFFKGSQFSSCPAKGELPDTISLKIRLEKKLEIRGLKISMDCVSLLNSSLDVYLKRLINPCLELANTRSGVEIHKQVPFGLNGLRPVRYVRKWSGPVSASLLDFRVATESDPSRLGEDWPEQLEKVCLCVADQQQ